MIEKGPLLKSRGCIFRFINSEHMKIHIVITAILGSLVLNSQPSKDMQKDLFDHLKTNALLLNDSGLIQDASETKAFISRIASERTYKKDFSIAVNAQLDYELGEIQTSSKTYAVMFLKTTGDDHGPQIEFLNIHEKLNPEDERAAIDSARQQWMKLCNAHQAKQLVEQVYQPDAYYFNRGRLIQGTKALSSEYGYMDSPNYSLKLTPKHMAFVSSDIAYEIGQCSGSYPLPYLLVWKNRKMGIG